MVVQGYISNSKMGIPKNFNFGLIGKMSSDKTGGAETMPNMVTNCGYSEGSDHAQSQSQDSEITE